ncbi:Ff.00g079240.m01.CDS01 [Fusarium sp. VM40]|nr:Ff.00g079240.m01.CDS01 [Fusarium sp. VM40]
MENQPDNRIIDLTGLDLFLEHVPDPGGRKLIREQIFFAAQIVEKKEDEVTRLQAEAEAVYAQVQEQQRKLEAQQKALADEQSRLNAIAEKASNLPDQVDGLTRQVNQVSSSLTKDSKTVVDELGKVQTSFQDHSEKTLQVLKGEITELLDKFDAVQRSAQDRSAESLQTIKDDISERITEHSRTALSREKSFMDEIAKLVNLAVSEIEQKLKTEMGKVATSLADAASDRQKLNTEIAKFDKSLTDSVADQARILETLTGRRGILAQLQPLGAKFEAMEKSVGSLPSKTDLSKALDESSKYADLLERYRKVTQERDESRVEGQSLRAEMDNLKERAAIDVRAASDRETLTNEKLELERQRVQRRDNTIQDLQDTCDATHQQLQEAQGRLEGFADLQQQLQDARARLEAAETAAQELQQTRDQLRRSEEAQGRYSRDNARQRGIIDQEKKLNTDRSQQINEMRDHLAASREQAEQARVKAEETATELRTRFEQQGALHQELKDAWANEKVMLQEEMSRQRSLLEDRDNTLELSRSKIESLERDNSERTSAVHDSNVQLEKATVEVRALEQMLSSANSVQDALRSELTAVKSSEDTAKKLAANFEEQSQAQKSDCNALEGRLSVLRHELATARSGEETAKQSVKGLQQELQSVNDQFTAAQGQVSDLNDQLATARSREDSASTSVVDLQQQLHAERDRVTAVEGQLSAHNAQQWVTIPEGVTGDLAKMYLRLADEFRDIPSAPQRCDRINLSQLAVEIAPILDELDAKENLLQFLNAGHQNWHCFGQVLKGDPRCAINGGTCLTHDTGCIKVRVLQLDERVLDFTN